MINLDDRIIQILNKNQWIKIKMINLDNKIIQILNKNQWIIIKLNDKPR